MDTLLFSLNAVLPILLTMTIGMLLRKAGLFPKAVADGANKLCFTLFIPLITFSQLYNVDIRSGIDLRFIGFGTAFILITLLLLCIFVPIFIKSPIEKGEFIQGVFRGNVSLISVSLLNNLYGDQGGVIISLLLPITIILYNSLSVVILAIFINGNHKPTLRSLLIGIIKNPFVIASFAGTLFALSPLRMPTALASTIKSISAIGSPLALLSLGSSIELKDILHRPGLGLSGAILRQLVIPPIILSIAVLLGFRGGQLGSYLCILCTPTATVGYVLALNMGGDGKLASKLLIYSTVLSFVSMFTSIYVLKLLNML